MKWRLLLLVVFAAFSLRASEAKDGNVRGLDLPVSRQPIYLVPNTLDFWPHDAGGNLVFKHEDSIDLYCESGFSVPSDKRPLLTATYSSLTERFKIDNTDHKLEEITCVRNPQFVANSQQGSCGGNYKLVKIGYNVAGRGFKTIYEICYDYNEMIAKYVKHTLRPGVLDKSKVSDRQTNFEDMASFGPYQFSSFYRNSDKLTLNRNSITRGHLAAQADFFYGVEQIATYIFPNAAPQWSRFNSGNWEELERLLRSNLRQKTLDCYTGVIGVMPYNNKKTGYNREALYLDDAAKKIPVPILYFRVVHDPRTEKGIVFVGVNNVFQKPLPEDYVVCNPVTDKVKGIVLNRDRMDNLNLGYVYACDFNEFHQRYPYLPSLSVKSLLFGEVETA